MTAPFLRRPTSLPNVRAGVLTLSGYGLRVAVDRGHLVTDDGVGSARRQGRFPRVGSGLRRLVVAGHGGTVSFDALAWMYETGVAFVQLSADGEVVTVGGPPMLDDVTLRRGQAFATANGTGVVVAKRLIHGKIAGQVHTLRALPNAADAAGQLAALLPVLDEARTLDRVRYVEARAAAVYWQCWEDLPVTFAARDVPKVPAHWLRVGTRRSGISQGPIKATSPAHAILNYLFAIVEAEATVALRAVGCEPALGVLHVDARSRHSLACDLMEPVRPLVDQFVLRMLRERVFLKSDFFERRDGNCRLLPPLTHALSSTATEWAERLAPYAEEVASMLRASEPPRVVQGERDAPLPEWVPRLIRSPLTGQNRSRRRFRPTMGARVPDLATMALGNRCRSCGVDMGARERTFCDACLAEHRKASSARGVASLRAVTRNADVDAMSRRTPETRRKLAERTRDENERRREWEETHGGRPNAGAFRKEFAGRLAVIPIEALMTATGFTRSNCRAIREERSTPHPMYWSAIRKLVLDFEGAHAPEERFDQRAPDQERWRREIAPFLTQLGAAGIERATGLSKSYSRRMLKGHHVPHPRHWPALLRAIREIPTAGKARRVTRT